MLAKGRNFASCCMRSTTSHTLKSHQGSLADVSHNWCLQFFHHLSIAKSPTKRMSGQATTFRNIKKPQEKKDHLESATDLFCDPTEKLQSLLEVPLFGENEKPYRPEKQEMLEAQDVFTSKKPKDIRRVESTINYEKAPIYDLPEIAFMGRSNVGKSSLIKAIFHKSPYVNVPVSKQPGFTKTLRFYQVKDFFTLVDMPGYGFNQPEYFEDCVDGFLQHRRNLVKVFLLYDVREVDLSDCQYMEQFHIPYAIVLNKIDLVNEAARLKMVAQVRQIREEYASPCCFPQPFLVSSKTGEGLAYIQAFIAHITGSLEAQAT